MTHSELVLRARRWLEANHSVVISEMTTIGEEPDAIGFTARFSTLVECKATRSDFKSDAKKYFRRQPEEGIGVYRYYMAPKGIISIEELPERWGLLEVTNDRIRRARSAQSFPVWNHRHEVSLLVSGLRRVSIMPEFKASGISVKCYTYQTQCRASLGVEDVIDATF